MSKSKVVIFLAGILIIAGFLRFYKITEIPPGLYPDEAMNGTNALEAIATGNFKLYYPENNGREGLFINIQALFLKTLMPLTGGNPEPWMLRSASAVFGTLTVLGLYFLGRELFSRRVGLLAAFFTATSFWHSMFSRIGFRAIMAPLLLTWGLYFFFRALRTVSPSHMLFTAFISGAVFGLGFHTYIAYRVMPILFILAIPFLRKMPNFWKAAASFVLGAFLVGLPIGIYYFQHPADFLGRTSQVSIFSSVSPLKELAINSVKTIGMFFAAGDFNQRHNLAGRPELFWPVGILFLVGAAVGIKMVLRNRTPKTATQNESGNQAVKINPLSLGASDFFFLPKFGFLIIFAWLILAALPVIISNEGLPHALRAILMIPPVMLCAAAGALWIYDRIASRFNHRILLFLVSVFLAFLAAETYRTYFVQWANHADTPGAFAADYAALGRQLNELPAETPKYVVVKTGGVLVHGIPMPAQTVMFITDTHRAEEQQAKKIFYILPDDEKNIPAGALKFYIE